MRARTFAEVLIIFGIATSMRNCLCDGCADRQLYYGAAASMTTAPLPLSATAAQRPAGNQTLLIQLPLTRLFLLLMLLTAAATASTATQMQAARDSEDAAVSDAELVALSEAATRLHEE